MEKSKSPGGKGKPAASGGAKPMTMKKFEGSAKDRQIDKAEIKKINEKKRG